MGFGVTEYTLVFKRVPSRNGSRPGRTWKSVRPSLTAHGKATVRSEATAALGVAHILVVPICSTLALDTPSYETFLVQSGVIEDALRILSSVSLVRAGPVETTRRQIQSLVMAAEVQHIVDGMSA